MNLQHHFMQLRQPLWHQFVIAVGVLLMILSAALFGYLFLVPVDDPGVAMAQIPFYYLAALLSLFGLLLFVVGKLMPQHWAIRVSVRMLLAFVTIVAIAVVFFIRFWRWSNPELAF